MLKLDLAKLEREGSLRVQGAIPEGDPLWNETALKFAAPLRVDLRARVLSSGEYLVQGALSGAVTQSCRRCLATVQVPVELDVTLLFSAADEVAEDGDADVRLIDAMAEVIDLGPPIREELILTVPSYVVCSADCKGLCPQCGVDRNVETCQCATGGADPRWDALRALKTD